MEKVSGQLLFFAVDNVYIHKVFHILITIMKGNKRWLSYKYLLFSINILNFGLCFREME